MRLNKIRKSQREQELYKKAQRRLNDILGKGLYKYIKGFVKKYPNLDESIRELPDLKELLGLKGINTSISVLKIIIAQEHDKIRFEQFKKTMNFRPGDNIEELVVKYVKAYGSGVDNFFPQFMKLINYINLQTVSVQNVKTMIQSELHKQKLKYFEKSLLQKETLNSVLENIDQMNGYEFEDFMKKVYEKLGYSVDQTPLSGDQGADLILKKPEEKIVVQLKRYKGKIGNKAVQEVFSAKSFYDASKAIVITNSRFTQSAIALANEIGVDLIDRDGVANILEKIDI